MSLVEQLESKGIHPQFWPPLDENGNAVSRWRGRRRSTKDSFAAYKTKEKAEIFVAKHVKRSKR